MGRARALVSETALTVKEVAFRCGFESEHYFSRLFKRKTDLAPMAWRRTFRVEQRTCGVVMNHLAHRPLDRPLRRPAARSRMGLRRKPW
jgi:AraC-like DNA-binding protein